MIIARDFLSPTIKLSKAEGKVSKGEALMFVKTYLEIILNYCTNIAMYLLLKASRKNVQSHPVIKRLYQYRQLLATLDPLFETIIKPQLDVLLVQATVSSRKEETKNMLLLLKNLKQNKKKVKITEKVDRPDKNTEFNEDLPPDEDLEKTEEMEVDELEESRRGITYQIAKNKGLTPRRSKQQRNPRVKYRNKYRKAIIRRKGAVRDVRTEMTRYGGEMSGIKTTVTKSIKIKS